MKETVIEYRVLMGMIDEVEAKAKLLMNRIDDGQIVSEDDVVRLEEDTEKYMKRLFELEEKLKI